MARISTYEIDTVIHADDNVIGTDPSSNNATRLYPVSSLANFIREGYSRVFDAEIEFGTAAGFAENPNLPVIPANGFLPAEYITTADTITTTDIDVTGVGVSLGAIPFYTLTHNFGTRNVIVAVYENVMRYVFSDESSTTPQQNNSYVSEGYQDVTAEVNIEIVDENTVNVGFGIARPISGNVIIIG